MPKAKITSTSKKAAGLGAIAKELKRRSDLFTKKIGGSIVIPTAEGGDSKSTDLSWVFMQEFGTATKREGDDEFGVPGASTGEYPIPSPENQTPTKQMYFPKYKGRTYGFKVLKNGYLLTPKGFVISHPGFKPKKFIRGSLKTIRESIKIDFGKLVAQAIQSENGSITIDNATRIHLQRIKEIIVAKMRQVFKANTRTDGKLDGQEPADIFNRYARIVMNTDTDGSSIFKPGVSTNTVNAALQNIKRTEFKQKKKRKLTPTSPRFFKASLDEIDLRFRHPRISRIRFSSKIRNRKKK